MSPWATRYALCASPGRAYAAPTPIGVSVSESTTPGCYTGSVVVPLKALAVVIGAALALVSGCGGGTTNDRVTGLTPDEILRQSATATASLTAFHVAVDATVEADVAPGALPKLVAQALGDSITITGEGPVNGDAASFDFDAAVTGLPPLQGNLTKVAGQLFAGVLGTDYRVDLPPAQVAAVVPGRLATGLLSWAGTPTEVGRETVDGVATVHLAAMVDTGRALADIAPMLQSLRGIVLTAAARRQLEVALTPTTVDLWIGVDDLILRRATTKLNYAGGVAAFRALRTGSLALDVRFTEFGQTVTITPPSTTNVLDLARLRGLASR